MIYSRLYLKEKFKVPTYLVLLILLIVTVFLNRIFFSFYFPSRASVSGLRRIEITNLTSNQATIYWQTDKKTTGWLIYGPKEDRLNDIVLDERDLSENKKKYFHHYVVIRNLQPTTTYYFKIVVDDKLVQSLEGKAFSFKTSPIITEVGNSNPIYGKILKRNGQPLVNSIVIFCLENKCPLATLTQSSGGWLITLNNLIDPEESRIINLAKDQKIKLEFFDEENNQTIVNGYLENLSPVVQPLIIGNNYDFFQAEQVLGTSQSQLDNKNNINKINPIDIVFPKENAIIPAGNPLIKGTALPGSQLIVLAGIKENISSKVTADKDGIWKVTLPTSLKAGSQKIVVLTKDSDGKEVKLTRFFTIAKSGEQVMGEATAEPTPTEIITTSPTEIPQSTPTPILLTNTPVPPVTGETNNFLIITSTSIIILGIGLLLAF
ncbi:MAG: fibronectin type III domain-containing protein [Microgenomates group bacterium]|nr:fibronectin type III domain-containing protein [Microgenomates group bacterium]